MIKKGKWSVPGYDEKFGSKYSAPYLHTGNQDGFGITEDICDACV